MGRVSVWDGEKRDCCTTGLPAPVRFGESAWVASLGCHVGKSGHVGRGIPPPGGEIKPLAARLALALRPAAKAAGRGRAHPYRLPPPVRACYP